MVYIVTGGRDSGKTARIAGEFSRLGGDGYVSRKVLDGGRHVGYDTVRLSTGEAVPLARRKGECVPDWDERVVRGDFSFSGRGMRFAESILEECAASGIARAFVDEVGGLDLANDRFRRLFSALLGSCRDVYAGVRRNKVSEFIRTFSIEEVQLIDMDEGGA